MAEKSLFWYTNGFTGDTGDGAAPYTQEEFRLFNHAWAAHNQANAGVFPNVLNSLGVSGIASPLAMGTGRAIVYGFPYWNDASLNLAVTTPSVGDTGGRVVLRAVWSSQTVRAVVVLNTDGNNAIPALTQTDGTLWEIPLATFVIDTSGNIWTDSGKSVAGVTDARVFIGPWVDTVTIEVAGVPGYIRVPAGGIDTNELAADSVDDTKAGNRVPQFYRRQGGSVSDWSAAGTTTYTPTAVRQQAGAITWSGSSASSGTQSVTFPAAFSEAPLVFVTLRGTPASGSVELIAGVTNISTTGFDIKWLDVGGNNHVTNTWDWFAVGAE